VAPRVRLTRPAVPADRGALGRYRGRADRCSRCGRADLAVACQRADEERYAGCAARASSPADRDRAPAGPAWPGNRPACHSSPAGERGCAARAALPMPLRPGVPVVATIHDLTYFTEPDAHNPVTATFFKSAILTAARRRPGSWSPPGDQDELVRVLAPTDQDRRGLPGVDDTLFISRPGAARSSRNRLGLHGRPYVAYLGTLEPRKNVPALITGWRPPPGRHPDPPGWCSAGQRLSGKWTRRSPRFPRTCACPPGYLRFTDLPGFLGGALVVAFPTGARGFGLQCWKPWPARASAHTHRTSLPEVGGGRGRLYASRSREHQAALRGLIDDPARRESLGTAGHARSQEFTWTASAEAHMASYQRAAAQRGE